MTITISVVWMVIIIIAIHTILTHLINWGWRGVDNTTYYTQEDWFGMLFITILEIIGVFVLTYSILT